MEGVIQQVEGLINLSKCENKFDGNVFPSLRDTIFEKTQQMEDISAEILNLMDEDNVMVKKTLSTKLFLFKKTKVLMISCYNKYFYTDLQQSNIP